MCGWMLPVSPAPWRLGIYSTAGPPQLRLSEMASERASKPEGVGMGVANLANSRSFNPLAASGQPAAVGMNACRRATGPAPPYPRSQTPARLQSEGQKPSSGCPPPPPSSPRNDQEKESRRVGDAASLEPVSCRPSPPRRSPSSTPPSHLGAPQRPDACQLSIARRQRNRRAGPEPRKALHTHPGAESSGRGQSAAGDGGDVCSPPCALGPASQRAQAAVSRMSRLLGGHTPPMAGRDGPAAAACSGLGGESGLQGSKGGGEQGEKAASSSSEGNAGARGYCMPTLHRLRGENARRFCCWGPARPARSWPPRQRDSARRRRASRRRQDARPPRLPFRHGREQKELNVFSGPHIPRRIRSRCAATIGSTPRNAPKPSARSRAMHCTGPWFSTATCRGDCITSPSRLARLALPPHPPFLQGG